jgi:3,4-dihydroxy 2-butanone 4-phosphate synthase/GTP cyclohydrolase II
VVIRQSESNKNLVELIHRYQLEDNGVAIPELQPPDWRMTGTGARILSDLGVHKLKVLGAQKKYVGLAGFDMEVTEHVLCDDWESSNPN